MSDLFVLDAPILQSQLKGRLLRIMYEVRQGVYVGKLPKKHILHIIDDLEKCGSPALAVFTAKNEQGFEIRVFGAHSRITVDNYGINLIMQKGK